MALSPFSFITAARAPELPPAGLLHSKSKESTQNFNTE